MEQKDNTGAIFKNDFKKSEQQPDYKGKAMINGEMKEIAMWLNESKAGKKYFSVKFSLPYQAEVEQGGYEKPKQEPLSDLPF
tara:strand:+ start:2140 stop:2385 length:246 start_codon:yes stop_codon:yes gene_type:complete